jgi:hypothetical protein
MEIKETKEATVAVFAVGLFVIDRLKDGAQWGDALALGQKLMDPMFVNMVTDAVEGIEQIPAEIKDISLVEAVELLSLIGDLAKDIK